MKIALGIFFSFYVYTVFFFGYMDMKLNTLFYSFFYKLLRFIALNIY